MAYTKITGVYRIHCSGNNKVYIGSSISIRQRLSCHLSLLRSGKHTNKHLQNSYNKYGADSFWLDILEETSPDVLIDTEQHYIFHYSAADPEFGMNNSWTASTTVGFRHSDETKQKLSEIAKKRTPDYYERIAEKTRGRESHNKGKPGIKWTDEQKAAMSAARKGQVAWNVGIPMADAVKEKVSASLLLNPPKYGKEVADRIFELRKEGLVWREISEIVGVSLGHCSKIFNGWRKFDNIQQADLTES